MSKCRTLNILPGWATQEDIDIIPQLLPHLQRLSQLVLNRINSTILAAIQRHPTAIVLVQALSYVPSSSDLARVVLISSEIRVNCFQKLELDLARGMRVKRLVIQQPHLFEWSLGTRKFHGLGELELTMHIRPVVLSWLLDFARAHPLLAIIKFTNYHRHYFKKNRTVNFVHTFVEAACREALLPDALDIKGFAITRACPGSASAAEPFREWKVTSFFLYLSSWCSGRALSLLHSSFPEISTLTIEYGCAPIVRLPCIFFAFSADQRFCRISSLTPSVTFLHSKC